MNQLTLLTEDSCHEHVYDVYTSQKQENLGYISKDDVLNISINNEDYEIKQNISVFNSERDSTGAVAWRTSQYVAEWLSNPDCFLARHLGPQTIAIELGCGMAALLAVSIGYRCGTYYATDQRHILKFASTNVLANAKPRSKQEFNSHIKVVELDWENPYTTEIKIDDHFSTGLILACDTIYNSFLIEPFLDTIKLLLNRFTDKGLDDFHVIIAVQARDPSLYEEFVESLLNLPFAVYIVSGNDCSFGFSLFYIASQHVDWR